jgi:predicted transcriptional regulator
MTTQAVVTAKDVAMDVIRRMPDDATVSDIIAELFFCQKVNDGLRQLDAGEGVPHEEAKQRLAQWLS